MESSGSTLYELARFSREIGAVPLEIRPRVLGEGAFLRLWVEDHATARRLKRRACDLGFLVPLMARHVPNVRAVEWDGWQLNIVVPYASDSEVRALQASMKQLGDGG